MYEIIAIILTIVVLGCFAYITAFVFNAVREDLFDDVLQKRLDIAEEMEEEHAELVKYAVFSDSQDLCIGIFRGYIYATSVLAAKEQAKAHYGQYGELFVSVREGL